MLLIMAKLCTLHDCSSDPGTGIVGAVKSALYIQNDCTCAVGIVPRPNLRRKMAAGELREKGGYDYDFVDGPPKSLECSICLLTLRDPHVISCCGNEFCQVCIERVQRDGKPCPLCNEPNFTTFLHKKLVREVNALSVFCPRKDLGCEWVGELGQLEIHSGKCGYEIVDCVHQCGARLQRKMVEAHERDACLKRLFQVQIASFVEKVEAVTLKLEAVAADNVTLQKEVKAVTAENVKLKREVDQIRETHKQELGRIRHCHREELKKIKLQMESKQLQLTHVQLPPFYFSIYNVDHYRINYLTFVSEPFYSHPGGYKLVVLVSFGKDYPLYVGVSITRGEFDDQLQWPFDGKITIQAYNRTVQRWMRELTIVVNSKTTVHVQKCEDVLAHGTCGDNFLSIPELLESYAPLSIDTVRLRVLKVEICNRD